MTARVLLIEDDDALRRSLTQTLELEDITVLQANGFEQAKRAIRANFTGVILSDIRMPRYDGFEVLKKAQAVDPDLPVILLTGEADVPMAVRALQNGAFDFLEKPCGTEQLLKTLRAAMAHRSLILQSRQLERQLERSDIAALNFPGQSVVSRKLRADLRRLAPLQVNLMLVGETGVGKRLAAHTLQVISPLSDHNEGINFKDPAIADQIAKLQLPRNTCLVLKNIDDASSEDLTALMERTSAAADLRVLMTSTRSFAGLAEGIRAILVHINPVEVQIPSLFQRSADLPAIFESLTRQVARDLNIDMPTIAQTTFSEIAKATWQGNLPELRSFARSYVLGNQSKTQQNDAMKMGLSEQMDAFEKSVLSEALRRNNWKASLAAKDLKLARKTMYDRLARHDIRPKDLKS